MATGDLRVESGRGGLRGIAITPDGTAVLVNNQRDETVDIIDLTTGSPLGVGERIPVPRNPRGLAIAPDSVTALVASDAPGVSVLDWPNLRVLTTIQTGRSGALDVAITPDGTTALVMENVLLQFMGLKPARLVQNL